MGKLGVWAVAHVAAYYEYMERHSNLLNDIQYHPPPPTKIYINTRRSGETMSNPLASFRGSPWNRSCTILSNIRCASVYSRRRSASLVYNLCVPCCLLPPARLCSLYKHRSELFWFYKPTLNQSKLLLAAVASSSSTTHSRNIEFQPWGLRVLLVAAESWEVPHPLQHHRPCPLIHRRPCLPCLCVHKCAIFTKPIQLF